MVAVQPGLFRAALSAGVFLAVPSVMAQSPGEPDRVRVSFTAPSTCPEKSRLMAQITERVTIAWLADETELARQIDVVLEPGPTGFVGRMEYVDESGRTVTRSLQAPDCERAMTGIALVTAIAIESQVAQPAASNETRSSPSEAPSSGQDAKALVAAPLVAEGPESPGQSPAQATPAAHTSPESPAPHPTMTRGADVHHEVGVLGGFTQGVGPGLAFGGAAFWGFGDRPFPWLRAIARWYETREELADVPGVTTDFRIISAGAELCASRSFGKFFAGALCAGVELGQYFAEATADESAAYETRTKYLFWAAAELALPLRSVGSPWFVELQPLIRFPLVSGSFELQNPDEPVYEIPRIALGLNLAVGLTFP